MSSKAHKIFDSFGETLKYVLDFRSLTGRELAEKLSIDESQISRYLNNKTQPFPNKVKQIANLLGVQISKDGEKWVLTLAVYPLPALPSMPSQAGEGLARVDDEPVPYGTTSRGAPAIARAREVDLGPDAKPTVEDVQALLEQIESLVRIARDTMKRL